VNLRRAGRFLRSGHRGAAALAPENTIAGFRAAIAHECDLVEFDIVDLPAGPLVVAHSLDLEDMTHGTLSGSASGMTLQELRHVMPAVPTLDQALRFFAEEAPEVGLHVDLKLRTRLDELVAAIVTHDLVERCLVTTPHAEDLRALRSLCPGLLLGLTYPSDRPSLSRRPWLKPVIHLVIRLMRLLLPFVAVRKAHSARADAFALQHLVVGQRVVSRLHGAGLAVVAWTVDDPDEIARMARLGVDVVVGNHPRLLPPGAPGP
jgi:glycerophosphoryl diester phosphodiesterase